MMNIHQISNLIYVVLAYREVQQVGALEFGERIADR